MCEEGRDQEDDDEGVDAVDDAGLYRHGRRMDCGRAAAPLLWCAQAMRLELGCNQGLASPPLTLHLT